MGKRLAGAEGLIPHEPPGALDTVLHAGIIKHASRDGGKKWQKTGDRPPEDTSFSSDVVVLGAKTHIANAAGWRPKRAWGIYRTEDGGETWARVSDAGPNGPPLVASDGAIYWQALWGQGLVKSSDAGKTWAGLGDPIPVKSSGVVYSDRRKCFYIWRSTPKKALDAIFRWDLPE